jgi:hypothetical protein
MISSLAEDPVAPKPSAQLSFRSLQEANEYQAAVRAAHLKVFRETFERGQTLNVRDRLDRAATASGELAALAEKISDSEIAERMASGGYPSRTAIYPRTSHLIRLVSERPWLRDQPLFNRPLSQLVIDSEEMRWPTEVDQPALRELLSDTDLDIRSMAVEALASLHHPSDLKWIIRAGTGMPGFGGGTPTIPVLSEQHAIWANGWPGGFRSEVDALVFDAY